MIRLVNRFDSRNSTLYIQISVNVIWVGSVLICCSPREVKLQCSTGYPATNLTETSWFNWLYRSWGLQSCGRYRWMRMSVPRLSSFIAVFSIQYCLYLDTLLLATTCLYLTLYCKFGNFRDNFVFTNSVKRHICGVKIANRAWFTYISKWQSDIANSRGFDFHETSHMHSWQVWDSTGGHEWFL